PDAGIAAGDQCHHVLQLLGALIGRRLVHRRRLEVLLEARLDEVRVVQGLGVVALPRLRGLLPLGFRRFAPLFVDLVDMGLNLAALLGDAVGALLRLVLAHLCLQAPTSRKRTDLQGVHTADCRIRGTERVSWALVAQGCLKRPRGDRMCIARTLAAYRFLGRGSAMMGALLLPFTVSASAQVPPAPKQPAPPEVMEPP